MERIFNLDPQLLQDALFLAVNIFILFVAGSYLLYNPVRNLLKKRQDMVQADIDAARKDKEDAAALKSEYDAKIKNAETGRSRNGFGKVECPSGRRIYLPGEGGRNGGYSGYFFCCPPGDYRMPEDRTGGARRGVAFYRRDVHGALDRKSVV